MSDNVEQLIELIAHSEAEWAVFLLRAAKIEAVPTTLSPSGQVWARFEYRKLHNLKLEGGSWESFYALLMQRFEALVNAQWTVLRLEREQPDPYYGPGVLPPAEPSLLEKALREAMKDDEP